VLLDEASHDVFVCLQCPEGPFFVLSHEEAITFHIGTEDGSEFAFYFLGGHEIPPLKILGRVGEKQFS
jgi:hypothetical protein